MKKISLIGGIIIIIVIGLALFYVYYFSSKPEPEPYELIEVKIIKAIEEAKASNKIVLTEEIKTPPYWIPFSTDLISESAGLNSENICFGGISEQEEGPINLKVGYDEVELIAHVGIRFEVVCNHEIEKLKERIIEKHNYLEIQPELLKIKEPCNPIPEKECCLLIMIEE